MMKNYESETKRKKSEETRSNWNSQVGFPEFSVDQLNRWRIKRIRNVCKFQQLRLGADLMDVLAPRYARDGIKRLSQRYADRINILT